VVHVVQDFAVRAAQKTHALLTVKVNRGVLWSIEFADHAASIAKVQVGEWGLFYLPR
jgi:hypothetical protein